MNSNAYYCLKNLNTKEKSLLNKIFTKGHYARKQLFLDSQLKISNFYTLIGSLIEKNIVKIASKQYTKSQGRPEDVLVFNSDLFYFLVVQVNRNFFSFNVINLEGVEIFPSENYPNSKDITYEFFYEKFDEFLKAIEKEEFCDKISVICLSSGIFIETNKPIFDKRSHPSWQGHDLLKELTETTKLPSLIFDISCSSATGLYHEKFKDLIGDLTVFNFSRGIGVATIHNGIPNHSNRYRFSTIEHWALDLDGKQCFCGDKGCLLTHAGIDFVIEEAKMRIQNDYDSLLNGFSRLSIDNIIDCANFGDSISIAIMEEIASLLARVIKLYLQIFPSDYLAVGGLLFNNNRVLFESLKKACLEKNINANIVIENNLLSFEMKGIAHCAISTILGDFVAF